MRRQNSWLLEACSWAGEMAWQPGVPIVQTWSLEFWFQHWCNKKEVFLTNAWNPSSEEGPMGPLELPASTLAGRTNPRFCLRGAGETDGRRDPAPSPGTHWPFSILAPCLICIHYPTFKSNFLVYGYEISILHIVWFVKSQYHIYCYLGIDINLLQWSVQFGGLGYFLKDEHIGSISNSRTLSPPCWDPATTTIHFLIFSQQPWQPPIYFLLLWIFLSSTFHIHWIKMWLCAWLFALCIIFASSSMSYSICFLSISSHLRWPNNNLPNVYDHILFMQTQWLVTCVISPSGQYKWFYSKHSGQVYKTMRCSSLGYVRESKIAGS